ncbi:MAG: hypothetical protein ACE5O2_13490, partial [Armatimonadota bacterium]
MNSRAAALTAALVLSVYLLTANGHFGSVDPAIRYEVMVGMVERGAVALPPSLGEHYLEQGLARRGKDGRVYSYF